MTIKTLFWNTWLDNHIASEDRRTRVWQRMQTLIDEHQPDLIGINEAVTPEQDVEPELIKVLRKESYQVEYEPNIPIYHGNFMGNIMASRLPYSNYRTVKTGLNVIAEKHGEPNVDVLHLMATIEPEGATPFSFGVVHMIPLYLYGIPEHMRQQRPFANLMNSDDLQQPVIVGGDFNEFKRMPRSFYSLVKKQYERKTGNLINPTWTAFAIPWHPFRGNYDHVYWTRNDSRLQLKSFKVISEHPSDHAPIVAEFELN